jgi:hypothetical protein
MLALGACDNSIDLFGPEREVPVLWCLFDAEEDRHLIRLQRSFQSEDGSALLAADDPALIYYPTERAELTIEEWLNGEKQRFWFAERIDADSLGLVKEPGLFADSPNVLYRLEAELLPEATYRLVLDLDGRKAEAEAETRLLPAFALFFPPNPAIALDLSDTIRYRAQWVASPGAQLFDGLFSFHYEELSSLGWEMRSLDIPVFRGVNRLQAGGVELMQTVLFSEAFYTGLRNALAPAPPASRRFVSLDFEVIAYGEDVYRLYLNNQAALGITALFITPLYTNVRGGLGIVSSRRRAKAEGLLLTPSTFDSLACGRFTRQLGFARPDTLPGPPDCP